MILHLKTKLLSSAATPPERAHPTDCGLDLFAAESKFLPANSVITVSTDIAVEIPVDYIGKIEGRSSLAVKGISPLGGVIDPNYSGPIKVVLSNIGNRSNVLDNIEGYYIEQGSKIAQLVIYHIETPPCKIVTDITKTGRGSNGFGSSGV